MLKVTEKGFMIRHYSTNRQTTIEDKKPDHPESPKPVKAGATDNRGRPKKNARHVGVSVYFSPEEKVLLQAKADSAGLSVASFIRSLVKKDLGI